jgi:sugar phosphate isomerase/epimerase
MYLTRRDFLQHTSTVGASFLLSTLDSLAAPKFMSNTGFELKVMGTSWGFPGTVDEFCAKAKKEGYDGIEMWWPLDEQKRTELFAALKKHQLEIGFLAGAYQPKFQEHFDQFKKMIDAAAANTIQKPLYINCHSGRDFFSFEQNKQFIDYTTQAAKQSGIPISHETHRSRMLFAAPIARQFIEKLPDLRITLDISHWCNVHESFLQDQQETVNMTLERVEHIHARIGHPEGPQVSDPRAPEWETAVKAHFEWWDKVVERKKKLGQRLTILTEFGPPNYMPTLPYTRQPLADQWAINAHMMQLLRKRYQS